MRRFHARLLVGTMALAVTTVAQQKAPAPKPAAESVGMSTERLARMHAAMQQFVDRKEVSGLVTLVERGGKVVDVYSTGEQDVERHVKMSTDTIFRIGAMSIR